MDLVEGNFTPVDFKSKGSTRALAYSMSRPRGMDGSHYSSGRPRDSTHDFSEVAEIHTRGRVCSPQLIRVPSPPADARRKQRVVALLETAVEGIASNRYHPQPGMPCSWCQFKNECMAWLPGMTADEVLRAA